MLCTVTNNKRFSVNSFTLKRLFASVLLALTLVFMRIAEIMTMDKICWLTYKRVALVKHFALSHKYSILFYKNA